jgi:hypothetical protein
VYSRDTGRGSSREGGGGGGLVQRLELLRALPQRQHQLVLAQPRVHLEAVEPLRVRSRLVPVRRVARFHHLLVPRLERHVPRLVHELGQHRPQPRVPAPRLLVKFLERHEVLLQGPAVASRDELRAHPHQHALSAAVQPVPLLVHHPPALHARLCQRHRQLDHLSLQLPLPRRLPLLRARARARARARPPSRRERLLAYPEIDTQPRERRALLPHLLLLAVHRR